jgi:hypothetical protein
MGSSPGPDAVSLVCRLFFPPYYSFLFFPLALFRRHYGGNSLRAVRVVWCWCRWPGAAQFVSLFLTLCHPPIDLLGLTSWCL